MNELVPMSIKGLMLDPVSNSPIVVLKDEEEKFFLPIWVGIFEANAIALQLENVATPRPMTHDLLKTAIAQLDARVTRIVINDLKDSTFFAQIRVMVTRAGAADTMLELDARPSDAIALALRTEAPIYVAQSVLDQAQTITPDSDDDPDEKTKKWFESLDTEDLGKYKM
jgi:bifunctional DNase/RNase